MATWDMSDEREFMENLLCQRFNFFLLLYGLVVAGAVSARTQSHLIVILAMGALITLFLGFTIYRANFKLALIINELGKDKAHPVAVIEAEARRHRCLALFSVRWVVGWFVPLICFLSLAAGCLLALVGLLVVPQCA